LEYLAFEVAKTCLVSSGSQLNLDWILKNLIHDHPYILSIADTCLFQIHYVLCFIFYSLLVHFSD